jgi:hypothetical protein
MTKPKRTECSNCESVDESEPQFCSNCGTEDPWEEVYQYDWDDVELPVVFSDEAYNDHYGLWYSFCGEVFGHHELSGDQIANLPDGVPRMKYRVVELYYKLDEDLELHGPFLDRQEVREA